VAYIANGYKNGKSAYISACKKLKRKESKNCETSASEILSNPNVIEFMDSIKVEAAKEVGIDAAWVLKNAKRVYDRCMQDEPVMANGEPTGEYKFEHSGANKALEIIGKHVDVQAYNEKHTVVEMSHEEWLDSLK
jgi:phage terminase small subunit